MTTLIAPLSNVKVSVPLPLRLEANLQLESIPTFMLTILKDAEERRFVRHPTVFSHCLVARNVPDNAGGDGSDLREAIEEAVLRLRLYKPGGVGFSVVFGDSKGWFDNRPKTPSEKVEYLIIGTFFYYVWERPGMPSHLEIGEADTQPLKDLFSLTFRQKLMDKPAFRYFFRGYHEPYATDRFLSNAIALENLLVNDTQDRSNYRYKFADRGCFLLQNAAPHPDGPEVYFKDMIEIYDARSEIVHTNNRTNRDWQDGNDIRKLQNSETYLRHLLRYVLEHPEMEKSAAVDRAKRKLYSTQKNRAA